MRQKTVFIAGAIGLLFGFLFSATLGVDLFPEEEQYYDEEGGLQKDEEAFRIAYNLEESIYIPITGDEAYEKIQNGDTFILYAGRSTCPYCQQYVPVLMDAAQNLNVTEIYHIDTTDPLNMTFKSDEGVNVTPTTFIYVDGVLVDTIIGYQTQATTEQVLSNTLPE